jgi:hypothetical protein
VVNPDNTVAIRQIKVAQIGDGQALIDSGLQANEQVVVDGQYKLQPGAHVMLRCCTARQHRKKPHRTPCRRPSHEHFRTLYLSADRDHGGAKIDYLGTLRMFVRCAESFRSAL